MSSKVLSAPSLMPPRSAVPHSRRSASATRKWRRSFTTPLLIVLLLTTIGPMIYTLVLSLGPTDEQLSLSVPKGFHNYGTLIHDAAFWQSLWLTVQFLIASLVIEVGVGVFASVLIDRLLPRTRLLRTFLLWPAVLPPIAVALIFKFELQGDIGMFSYYLGKTGYRQAWFSKPHEAMAALVGIDAWQYMPFVILLALAALQAFPSELREASLLDGASVVQEFRYVVLPSITPVIIAIALLRFIDAIQLFPTIFVLTAGGPGTSTQMLTYYTYSSFFTQLQFGYGAALAVVVVLFTIACVVLLVRWQRRLETRLGA